MKQRDDSQRLHQNLRGVSFGVALAAGWFLMVACTVKDGSQPVSNPGDAAAPTSRPDCAAVQQACVDRCNRAASDEASRQPCYTRCLKEGDACRR